MTSEPKDPRAKRFLSPFDVPPPEGCEGWEEMYPYYHLFSEDRRAIEESKLWTFDCLHFPEPLYPFDAILVDCVYIGLGQYNSRIFVVPYDLGLSHRILNGYFYVTAERIEDEAVASERAAIFMRRAGYYYQNWDRLFGEWRAKVTQHIRAVEGLEIPLLPDIEDEAIVLEGRGLSTGHRLLEAYDTLISGIFKVWQYHFELLNLGYAAYATFLQACGQWFPGIPEDVVTRMVAGLDTLLYRPDEELKKLARLAVDLGLGSEITEDAAAKPDEVIARLRSKDAGRTWLAALEEAKDPWFNLSSGVGFYHHDRSWKDDLSVPFMALRGYIAQLEQGKSIERPTEALRSERERIAGEYRALLPTDEDRRAFDDALGLSRTVFPYVEDHNFFVEHWFHSVFWNKVREIGRILAGAAFFADASDIFYLNRHEVSQALCELVSSWAVGSVPRGPKHWPPIVARRRRWIEAMRRWQAPPVLGPVPPVLTSPMMTVLQGISTERLAEWLDEDRSSQELRGVPASPGVVEGPARVMVSAAELAEIGDGEILVCPTIAPSWAPMFPRIKAAVSDVGGVMSHAAIVAREYGLPAVVGTGFGSQRIRTGQRIRVDGDRGIVTILE
jgi:pyruvate,water dikinase